jgi:hypothetical protein
MKKASRALTPHDIARERGISYRAALRLLHEIAERRPDLVRRSGTGPRARLTITTAALRSADGTAVEEDRLDEIEDLRTELSCLRESFVALERRQRKLEVKLSMGRERK